MLNYSFLNGILVNGKDAYLWSREALEKVNPDEEYPPGPFVVVSKAGTKAEGFANLIEVAEAYGLDSFAHGGGPYSRYSFDLVVGVGGVVIMQDGDHFAVSRGSRP